MASLIRYFAHPGMKYSIANRALNKAAVKVDGVTHVDLYAQYPDYSIDIDVEQSRLLEHDVIVLQFPIFWYSSPALLKEWVDLVFEHGFAYGAGGTKLVGKSLILAVTASATDKAYSKAGYQNFPMRTFLTPFEQTANLTGMRFVAPYVLFGALRENPDAHANGFAHLLEAIRDDRFDFEKAKKIEIMNHENLPLLTETKS